MIISKCTQTSLLLLFVAFNACTESNYRSNKITSGNNEISGDCANPDADIRCCFENMPEQLTQVMIIADQHENGDPLVISGQIFKKDSVTPIPNVIIYAYQTDQNGYYSKRGNEKGVQKWHGKLHGWCKTDKTGRYEIRTIRPAPYPDNAFPAHIHAAIQLPDNSLPFYINDFVFADDPLVDEAYKTKLPYKVGGPGILHLLKNDGISIGERNMIL